MKDCGSKGCRGQDPRQFLTTIQYVSCKTHSCPPTTDTISKRQHAIHRHCFFPVADRNTALAALVCCAGRILRQRHRSIGWVCSDCGVGACADGLASRIAGRVGRWSLWLVHGSGYRLDSLSSAPIRGGPWCEFATSPAREFLPQRSCHPDVRAGFWSDLCGVAAQGRWRSCGTGARRVLGAGLSRRPLSVRHSWRSDPGIDVCRSGAFRNGTSRSLGHLHQAL